MRPHPFARLAYWMNRLLLFPFITGGNLFAGPMDGLVLAGVGSDVVAAVSQASRAAAGRLAGRLETCFRCHEDLKSRDSAYKLVVDKGAPRSYVVHVDFITLNVKIKAFLAAVKEGNLEIPVHRPGNDVMDPYVLMGNNLLEEKERTVKADRLEGKQILMLSRWQLMSFFQRLNRHLLSDQFRKWLFEREKRAYQPRPRVPPYEEQDLEDAKTLALYLAGRTDLALAALADDFELTDPSPTIELWRRVLAGEVEEDPWKRILTAVGQKEAISAFATLAGRVKFLAAPDRGPVRRVDGRGP